MNYKQVCTRRSTEKVTTALLVFLVAKMVGVCARQKKE